MTTGGRSGGINQGIKEGSVLDCVHEYICDDRNPSTVPNSVFRCETTQDPKEERMGGWRVAGNHSLFSKVLDRLSQGQPNIGLPNRIWRCSVGEGAVE